MGTESKLSSLACKQDSFKYVIGIDFGEISSGLSIAHKDNSSKIYTVNKWKKGKKSAANNQSDQSEQLPTTIKYKKNGDREIIDIGIAENDVFFKADEEVCIYNIKQYIFADHDSANQELGQLLLGLTVEGLVTDYLKEFHKLAISRLEVDPAFKKSEFREDFKEDVKKEDVKVKLENIRYCLACPQDQQEFMKQRFVDAKIIMQEELGYRLSFVTEAEATAYHCLTWDRQSSKIKPEKHYLICDIAHRSVGISKIKADTTESLSEVGLVSTNTGIGSMALENNLKVHLQNLNLDQTTINKVVKEFIDKFKFSFGGESLQAAVVNDLVVNDGSSVNSIFETINSNNEAINVTYDDLNTSIFSPAIDNIIECILAEAHNDKIEYQKIFLSGRYGYDSYLIDKLTHKYGVKSKDSVVPLEHLFTDCVSRGAVSYGLRKKDSQIPYFNPPKPQEPDAEGTKTEYTTGKTTEGVKDKKNTEDEDKETYDFIVGIDFGTTYSGCSYARPGEQSINIKTISTDWPGDVNQGFGKTPTLLIYNKKTKKMMYWGQNAKNNIGIPGSLLFGNFKLFLSPQAARKFYGEGNKEFDRLQELYNYDCKDAENRASDRVDGKIDAVDVIADYLRYFNEHVTKYIQEKEAINKNKVPTFLRRKTKNKLKFKYVITVPAIWNTVARETMAVAAIKAGLIKEDELKRLLIISEPEAAALYCENRYKDFVRSNGMTFLVCDAGGGTVDLVTFRFDIHKKTDKDGKEFEEPTICQLGDGEGDICGSTYLDTKFRDYLLKFYKDIGFQVDPVKVDFDSVIDDFVNKKKPNFLPDRANDSFYDIDLPSRPQILSYDKNEDNKHYTLTKKNRILRMKNEEMETIVFDPIMKQIETLLDKQLKKTGGKVDTIILVGGFSQSKYLQHRLKKRYEPDIKVGFPPDGVTAISHGAVSYALNPRLITRKFVGQSLAVEVQAPFEKDKEKSLEKITEDAQGVKFSNRLEYFVRKGHRLEDEETSVYEKTVYIEYPKNAVLAIFSCDSDNIEALEWRHVNDKHIKVMEMNVDMPLVSTKKEGEKIEFKVTLKINHIGVTLSADCQDHDINQKVRESTTTDEQSLKFERTSNPIVLRSERHPSDFNSTLRRYWFGHDERDDE